MSILLSSLLLVYAFLFELVDIIWAYPTWNYQLGIFPLKKFSKSPNMHILPFTLSSLFRIWFNLLFDLFCITCAFIGFFHLVILLVYLSLLVSILSAHASAVRAFLLSQLTAMLFCHHIFVATSLKLNQQKILLILSAI